MPKTGDDQMSDRQALALALMATEHVAGENADIRDWRQAAAHLREMLHADRPPTSSPLLYSKPKSTRRRR